MAESVTAFWFRRDLRLNDNHGLYSALKKSQPVLPLFIFDTNILNELPDNNDKRVAIIHKMLRSLNEELKKHGSSLYVFHGKPLDAFKILCTNFDVKEVITNHDYEPYAIERDKTIRNFLLQNNIPFTTYKDQVIFEKSDVMKTDDSPYTIYTPYSRAWKQRFAEEQPSNFPSEECLSNLLKTNPFDFPTLRRIGFEDVKIQIPELNISGTVMSHYEETHNIPSADGTSNASVHLRFGTVSIRHLVKLAVTLSEKWLNELIWREFFMMILFHFPHVVTHNFKKDYDNIKWRNNEKEFALWCKGETGYPLVDAGMRQLNKTGQMHNRVRLVTASFLTKDLLIDWRWGEAYFASKLLDYELSSNNGNWQWVAGTGCDAAPYFRIFNPSEQIKRFDPQLKYIKRWIKNFRADYLPPIVDHPFARKRAIEVYKKAVEK